MGSPLSGRKTQLMGKKSPNYITTTILGGFPAGGRSVLVATRVPRSPGAPFPSGWHTVGLPVGSLPLGPFQSQPMALPSVSQRGLPVHLLVISATRETCFSCMAIPECLQSGSRQRSGQKRKIQTGWRV